MSDLFTMYAFFHAVHDFLMFVILRAPTQAPISSWAQRGVILEEISMNNSSSIAAIVRVSIFSCGGTPPPKI